MGPNYFIFTYIFTKKHRHQRSTPPQIGSTPPSPPREILDLPLLIIRKLKSMNEKLLSALSIMLIRYNVIKFTLNKVQSKLIWACAVRIYIEPQMTGVRRHSLSADVKLTDNQLNNNLNVPVLVIPDNQSLKLQT